MFLYCRSVTIEKCRNTTIILGPVETVVYMSHCESVTLICFINDHHKMYLYCRSVTIEKCRNTTIILGPVETVVYMSHCESVTLICFINDHN